MGRPTALTAQRRQRILEALQIGASRRTAAAVAGTSDDTIRRAMERGRNAAPGTADRTFHDAVLEAEAHPRTRALGIIYREMENRPDLAWKFIERREPGFAPPQAAPPSQPQQVVIALSLPGGRPIRALEPAGEVIDVPNEAAASRRKPASA
jgi:hypothetical protein